MHMITSRLAAIGPWLWQARHPALSVGVIGVALVVSLRPHTPEPTIRLSGLVLQLMGVVTVLWGIRETRSSFGRPPVLHQVRAWLRAFPLRRRSVVIAAGTASIGAFAGTVHAHVVSSAGPNATTDERLAALERNIDLLHERISATQLELDRNSNDLKNALRQEAGTRLANDQALGIRIEDTGTGGLHISAIGASWFFAGTILGTAGPEIAALLR